VRTRRLGRFVVEVAFLGGLAALAAVARLRPEAVIAVMGFGWVVVALAEWSWWLDRPHFGRGLPPRYYVPQVSLPPAQPIEQRPLAAMAAAAPPALRREEEETWIESSPNWAKAFDEWPQIDLAELGEDTGIQQLGLPGEPLPAALLGAALAGGELDAPTELFEVEIELTIEAPPDVHPGAVPLPPLEDALPEEAEPPPVPPAEPPAPAPAETPAPAPAEAPPPVPRLERVPPRGKAARPTSASLRARHRIDPFAPLEAPRWRRRRDPGGVVNVPNRPPIDRPPPARPESGGPF
jgi:hypothetical protein